MLHVLTWLLVLVPATYSWAGTDGSVSGTVKDTSRALVRNANVTAKNVDPGVGYQVTTNDSGFYSFSDLPIGRYDVSVESAGLKTFTVELEQSRSTRMPRSPSTPFLRWSRADRAITVNGGSVHVETSDLQGGRGDQRHANGFRSLERPQLYRSALAAAWRRAGKLLNGWHSAGRGCQCRFHAIGRPMNPGTTSINGQQGILERFYRERK